MKKHYQINEEIFRCEAQARHRLEEVKLQARQNKDRSIIELWEVKEEMDVFNNIRQLKQLVTRYTPNLPNNGLFRIQDTYDIRRAKKMYSLQKYDSCNQCWNNFKMADDLGMLIQFMMTYAEVK